MSVKETLVSGGILELRCGEASFLSGICKVVEGVFINLGRVNDGNTKLHQGFSRIRTFAILARR